MSVTDVSQRCSSPQCGSLFNAFRWLGFVKLIRESTVHDLDWEIARP